MLFNSLVFVLGFLPAVVIGFALLARRGTPGQAMLFLVGASLLFYAAWNPPYLFLLVGSVAFNYGLGQRLRARPSRWVLGFGIAANLGAIGYFKYANFFLDNVNALTGGGLEIGTIVLPLAISFFTFQQIAYLIEAHRGDIAEHDFLSYALFVTFFPQLIAGPIVRFNEVVPQFAAERFGRLGSRDLALGATLFVIGLGKKVLLADSLARAASPVFQAAELGLPVAPVEAWTAALAYSFQLYFDFSGYSDMAIGLACLFGIRLPWNFASPYKATSVIEFWRRWHMTLSRFLRDYLYIPLGGNRKGPARRTVNLMIVMLLGGLWHGAGWSFVIWGGLHGLYLCVNSAWRAGLSALGRGGEAGPLGRLLGLVVTFLAVTVAWVFFRAETLDGALVMLQAMAGQGAAQPGGLIAMLPLELLGLFAVAAALIWGAPNTMELSARLERALSRPAEQAAPRAALPQGILVGGLAAVSLFIIFIGTSSEFIYFQF